jgi:hypothetical protein
MYSDTIIKMQLESKCPTTSRLLMKYGELSDLYANVCFVEGRTDREFFENSKHPILDRLSPYYIFAQNDDSKVGKEAVIDAYKKIPKLYYQNRKGSVVFIVDHDFFGLQDYIEKYKLLEEDEDNITVLPVHSHEMYFLSDGNIDKVFSFFGLDEKLCKAFLELLCSEHELLIEYFALKATETWMYHHVRSKIGTYENRKEEMKNAFNFQFSMVNDKLSVQYDRDKIREDIRFIENKIKADKVKLKSKNKRIKKELRDNHLLLHGHTMLNFLESFLHQICGIDKNEGIIDCSGHYNSHLLKSIDIDIDIVTLKLIPGKGYQILQP